MRASFLLVSKIVDGGERFLVLGNNAGEPGEDRHTGVDPIAGETPEIRSDIILGIEPSLPSSIRLSPYLLSTLLRSCPTTEDEGRGKRSV